MPGGRPPKKEGEARRHSVGFKLTDAEYEEVKTMADSLGIPLGTMARKALLRQELKAVPQVNHATWAELGKVGGLLKQMLGVWRSGEVGGVTAEDRAIINKLTDLLKALRNEVRGQ